MHCTPSSQASFLGACGGALTTAPHVQDLCRTDPRGVQLLQALGAVHNPALAVTGLHTVPSMAPSSAAAIPRVLSSPSLPPLCSADAQRQNGGGGGNTPPPMSSPAPRTASPAAQPRKRGKRTRAAAASAAPPASAAADQRPPSSRAAKRSRPSPLGSPAAAGQPAAPAPAPAPPPQIAAAQVPDSLGVARDLMALLVHQIPSSATLPGQAAMHNALTHADAISMPAHGAAAAPAVCVPGPAARTRAAPGSLPAGMMVSHDGSMHGFHASAPAAQHASATDFLREMELAARACAAASVGSPGVGNDGAASSITQPPAAARAAAAAGSTPLLPEQRAALAQRLEVVFGGMGMDSATISAGLAIALGGKAGHADGQ